jgi:hypothetical protein
LKRSGIARSAEAIPQRASDRLGLRLSGHTREGLGQFLDLRISDV